MRETENFGRLWADIIEWIAWQFAVALMNKDTDRAERFSLGVAVIRLQMLDYSLGVRVVARLATQADLDARALLNGGVYRYGQGSPVPDGDGFNVVIVAFVGVFAAIPQADLSWSADTRVTEPAMRAVAFHQAPVFHDLRDGFPLDLFARVRLAAIDAPEIKSAGGASARAALIQELAAHKYFVLDAFKTDAFSRLLVVVRLFMQTCSDDNLNDLVFNRTSLHPRFSLLHPDLLRGGHATLMPHMLQLPLLARAQLRAVRPFPTDLPIRRKRQGDELQHEVNKCLREVLCLFGPDSQLAHFEGELQAGEATKNRTKHIYNSWLSLAPFPLNQFEIRHRQEDGLGVYAKIAVTLRRELAFELRGHALDTLPAASDPWRVRHPTTGIQVLSNPYRHLSLGMLINEPMRGEKETAWFRLWTKRQLWDHTHDLCGKNLTDLKRLMPLEGYHDSEDRVICAVVWPRSYQPGEQILLKYGDMEFDRSDYTPQRM